MSREPATRHFHKDPAMTGHRAPDTDGLALQGPLRRTVAPTRVTPAGARTPPPVGADELRARSYLHRMGVVL